MTGRRWEQVPTAAFGVAAVLVFVCVMFWHAGMPVLGDYGEWAYQGVLLRDVLAGRPDAAYVLKHYPVPNSLTTAGMGVLMLLLPWKIAAKLWLVVELVLGLVCGYGLNRASSGRDGWVLWVLPGAVLCGLNFWAGFSNFMFGVYLAMLLCAMLLRGVRSRWSYGVVLLLLFFSHMIPFAFGCLVLAAYAWQTGRVKLLWHTVPGLLLTGCYVLGRFVTGGNADGKAGMEASTRWMSGPFFLFKVNTYLKCWGLINPALTSTDSVTVKVLGEGAFAGLMVVDIGVALLVAAALWQSGRRAFRERGADAFLWTAVGLFVVVSFVLPGTALGISDPGGRMLQTAVWTGLVASATGRRWQGPVLAAGSVLLFGANLLLFATVGFRTPVVGATDGRLPRVLRVFAHVYYADRAGYPRDIERGEMDQVIYPTALFLKRP